MRTNPLSAATLEQRRSPQSASEHLTARAVIKSWLDPVTTSRVAILGTDQKKVRERLLAFIKQRRDDEIKL